MSLVLNGSGTITGITAGGLPDATITQAELATGVAGTGPAFSAWAGSATSLSSGASTKVLFNTEEFDTASCFNNTGSTVNGIPPYAFMPTVAGYYQVTSSINTAGYISINSNLSIFKNGSAAKVGLQFGNSGNSAGVSVSALIYMNGSTDYLEIYAYHATGSAVNTTAAQPFTYFQAFLARAA